MQSINAAAPASPLFMATLLGTGALSAGIGVVAATRIREPHAARLVTASAFHLASVVVTAAYHVPRNEALALLDAEEPRSTDLWHRYARGRTAWNHVRSVLPVAASAVYLTALCGTDR